MSKICKSCGGDNPDSAIYCVQCNKMLNVMGGLSKKAPPAEAAAEEVAKPAAAQSTRPKSTPQAQKSTRSNPPVAGAQFSVDKKPAKKGKGCLFWGCMSFVLLGLVIVGLIGAGIYVGREQLRGIATDRPVTIKEFKATEAQTRAVRTKLDDFKTGKTNRLVITAIDLNTLISTTEGFEGLNGNLYFYINNGILRVKTAVPLDAMGLSGYYLSGRVDLKTRNTNGEINIFVDRIEGSHGIITSDIVTEIKKINLYESMLEGTQDKNVKEFLESLKQITIDKTSIIFAK